jgi:outer membrane protein assembly factor BamB
MTSRWMLSIVPILLLGCVASTEPQPEAKSGPDAPLPPDLRKRKDGDDWPRFLGPTSDSVSREKGILTQWPKAGPKIVWQAEVGEGYAMPTVSRGRLFLFDRVKNAARLRCLESETGKALWEFTYPTDYRDQYNYSGGPRCCPVVDGDRVYLFGPAGMLHCVRAEDGKLVWKQDTSGEFGVVQNFFGAGSTPIVEGNLLLTMVGGSPKESADAAFDQVKSNGSALVAFDKFTGAIRWKVGQDLASYASPIVATFGKQRVALAFCRGGLLGVEAATGKLLFDFPWRSRLFESVNAANPVVVGNRILISETYGPGAALLEYQDGKIREIWTDANKGRDKAMQAHWATPIHVDGHVYGCSGRHTENAELHCIELATGKVLWSEFDLTRTSLLRVDGHLVVLGEDGVLRLVKLNPKKYEEVARVILGGENKPLLNYPCWAAPILSHGLLYVRGKDRLVCLELIPQMGN